MPDNSGKSRLTKRIEYVRHNPIHQECHLNRHMSRDIGQGRLRIDRMLYLSDDYSIVPAIRYHHRTPM
ncbi:hypothetical protein PSAB6_60314 [Paraburkholderia sabiae]|nr:hypothetical protein PSAB6_60314 [Paraburkholderia sabiae]